MNNSDTPAMPLSGDAYQDFAGYNPSKNDSSYNPECQGLTKLEMFTLHAMQGILSRESSNKELYRNVALDAVSYAEAALKELTK